MSPACDLRHDPAPHGAVGAVLSSSLSSARRRQEQRPLVDPQQPDLPPTQDDLVDVLPGHNPKPDLFSALLGFDRQAGHVRGHSRLST